VTINNSWGCWFNPGRCTKNASLEKLMCLQNGFFLRCVVAATKPLHCLIRCLSHREERTFHLCGKLVIFCGRAEILLPNYPTINVITALQQQHQCAFDPNLARSKFDLHDTISLRSLKKTHFQSKCSMECDLCFLMSQFLADLSLSLSLFLSHINVFHYVRFHLK
jgi:hypothetical protein